jgi:ferrous iron transport protein A
MFSMHGFMRGFMHRFERGFGHGFGQRHGFRTEGDQVALARMQSGQSGTVVEILGRRGAVNRLGIMGIRPGKRLTKISSMFMRGPVTIQLDSTQVAINFGMARKIIVKLD